MCLCKSFLEMNQNFECTHTLTALLPPPPEGQKSHVTDTLWAFSRNNIKLAAEWGASLLCACKSAFSDQPFVTR